MQLLGYRNQMMESCVSGKLLSQRSITATDISVAARISRVGNSENVQHLEHSFVEEAVKTIRQMLEDCIDEAKIDHK